MPYKLDYVNAKEACSTRSLILLGASGSIGGTCIDFLRRHLDINVKILAISVHSSTDFLRSYLSKNILKTKHVAISSENCKNDFETLKNDFPKISFYLGAKGLLEMIEVAHQEGADTTLNAIVGASGIYATLSSIRLGMKVALANKESLVVAGPVIQKACEEERKASLLPVDSEHNSIFRLLSALDKDMVQNIILSASGGPFRDKKASELALVTKEEVLQHPNWDMGAKITVDSAGMINKGLEIIEAHFLFACDYDSLEVWLHRESIVHAGVELKDGSYLMHASTPHMIFPIAHALVYPEVFSVPHLEAKVPASWSPLSFQEISKDLYPGFYLCLEAAKLGGTATAIFNASNEVAVKAFLQDQIHFTQITSLIDWALNKLDSRETVELEIFIEADQKARELTKNYLETMK